MRFLSAASTALLLGSVHSLGVYVSTEENWGNREKQGSWKYFTLAPGECANAWGTVFDNSISSFGPDPGTKCIVYDEYNCQGVNEPKDKLPIRWAGYAKLSEFGWDNKISSFRCEVDPKIGW